MKNNIKLFTPGPLNTSSAVKMSMNIDIGSRTETLVTLTKNIRDDLEDIAACGHNYTSVLLQGSGTFAIEAMLTTLIQEDSFVLVVTNGIYGDRIAKICEIHNIRHKVLKSCDTTPIELDKIESVLATEKEISHIAAVQFETGLGVYNNINELLSLAENYQCEVLVDAISAFGALPLDYKISSLTAVASSANKCLHGVPGISFVIVRLDKLSSTNKTRTLSLDLQAQWLEFERSGQWRFTPPTHILLALKTAITEFKHAGGSQARLQRYTYLTTHLIARLAEIDIYPVIKSDYRAPIITTLRLGDKHTTEVAQLQKELFMRGLVIYPSNFCNKRAFRIGCIGDVELSDIDELIKTIKIITM